MDNKLVVAAALSAVAVASSFWLLKSCQSTSNSDTKAKKYPKLKLYYFNIPGKGEFIRLICKYANIPLEDVRVSMEEWPKMKKESNLMFSQLPALEVDGKTVIVQSASIMRYLGKLTGLYPRNDDLQAALIDSIVDEEVDLFTGVSVSRYQARYGFGFLAEQKELLAIVRKDLNDTILPRHLAFLEQLMTKSTTGWIANTKEPSIADFILVPRLQWLASGANDGISTEILVPYTNLTAMMDKFMKLPAIQSYYSTSK